MSRAPSCAALVACASILSACTSTQQMAHVTFKPPEGNYKLIVMQPDISVGVLTAGGAVEPREDWTTQARENVLKALAAQQAARGGSIKIVDKREDAGGDPAAVADLAWLHQAVGSSIMLHKYAGMTLPTKKDTFDWTLGKEAVAFGAATHYDYALFLYAEDSFSSGGRVALQVAGVMACVVGVCVIPSGGIQAAFASLVDLKTGNVVWFNFLATQTGDIRTPDGARQMVDGLLGEMQPGGSAKANGGKPGKSKT